MGVLDCRETWLSAIRAFGAAVSALGRGAVQLECVAFLELGVHEILMAKEEELNTRLNLYTRIHNTDSTIPAIIRENGQIEKRDLVTAANGL